MNTSEHIEITQATIIDLPLVQEISKHTFLETFSSSNNEADMQQYLEKSFSSKKLREELSNADSEFYLAKSGNRVVGYLKINVGASQTESLDHKGMEIERIYTLKEFHGRQVGKLLFERAVNAAKEIKAPYVWLGVWEENARAINFYKKNGFEEFGKHVFKLGNDDQTDIMMKKTL